MSKFTILEGGYTTTREKTNWHWLFDNQLAIKVAPSLRFSLPNGKEGYIGERTIYVVCFDINQPLSMGQWIWNNWVEESFQWIRDWIKTLPEFKELEDEVKTHLSE